MKHLIALSLLAFPLLSIAQSKVLPEPRKGEEICYSRVLSKELLAKRQDIKIKAIAVTIEKDKDFDYNVYSKILVVRADGEVVSHVGVLKTGSGSAEASFELEGSKDSLVIAQEQKNNRVRIKINNQDLINKVNTWLSGTKADSGMREIQSMALRKSVNDLDKNGYNKKSCSELVLEEIAAEI
jgi:hypothetical protein